MQESKQYKTDRSTSLLILLAELFFAGTLAVIAVVFLFELLMAILRIFVGLVIDMPLVLMICGISFWILYALRHEAKKDLGHTEIYTGTEEFCNQILQAFKTLFNPMSSDEIVLIKTLRLHGTNISKLKDQFSHKPKLFLSLIGMKHEELDLINDLFSSVKLYDTLPIATLSKVVREYPLLLRKILSMDSSGNLSNLAEFVNAIYQGEGNSPKLNVGKLATLIDIHPDLFSRLLAVYSSQRLSDLETFINAALDATAEAQLTLEGIEWLITNHPEVIITANRLRSEGTKFLLVTSSQLQGNDQAELEADLLQIVKYIQALEEPVRNDLIQLLQLHVESLATAIQEDQPIRLQTGPDNFDDLIIRLKDAARSVR